MKNRTYRYFTASLCIRLVMVCPTPNFAYFSKVSDKKIKANKASKFFMKVKNTGKVAGDEVVQLKWRRSILYERALKELRGLERVHIPVGETRVKLNSV